MKSNLKIMTITGTILSVLTRREFEEVCKTYEGVVEALHESLLSKAPLVKSENPHWEDFRESYTIEFRRQPHYDFWEKHQVQLKHYLARLLSPRTDDWKNITVEMNFHINEPEQDSFCETYGKLEFIVTFTLW